MRHGAGVMTLQAFAEIIREPDIEMPQESLRLENVDIVESVHEHSPGLPSRSPFLTNRPAFTR